MIDLKCGDCLELMKDIPDGSVDMILCDLPYGVTACEWDAVIPFEPLWEQYHRVIRSGGAIVLFSQLPFACDLIQSNRKEFRYEWVWEKPNATGFLNANRRPLRAHENILVFYNKLPTYNPQKTEGKPYSIKRSGSCIDYGKVTRTDGNYTDGKRYPRDVIEFKKEVGLHPTQKPVALCEYLIRTYTNEGETVLDNCMGSGTTGVACVNLNRNFIGIELDKRYYAIAKDRIWEQTTKVDIENVH